MKKCVYCAGSQITPALIGIILQIFTIKLSQIDNASSFNTISQNITPFRPGIIRTNMIPARHRTLYSHGSFVNIRFFYITNTFHKDRSSRPKLFCKICKINVSKYFTTFTRKQLFQSFVLKKVARRRVINNRLRHRYFPVSFTKFLRTPILKNFSEWLLTNLFMKINHLP